MPKRIFVCEFRQESNTFNPVPASRPFWQIAEGREAYEKSRAARAGTGGIIDAVEEAGGEAVCAVTLHAGSGGRVSNEVFGFFLESVRRYWETAGPFDGVCVCLHGATCTESLDDPCGEALRQLRALAGPRLPLAASFDLHANITDRMIGAADILCGYQHYPHIDIYETGRRAGSLLMRLLAGERLVMAAAAVPMLTPPSGYTTRKEPFRALADLGRSFVEDGSLEDYTVFNVQPWLDIPDIQSRVITIAHDPETALDRADRLAEKLWEVKDGCRPNLMTIDEVIDRAEDPSSRKPVILVDAADSPNGGAVGDSVAAALRLQARGSKLSAGMFVADPAAVKKAFELGVGARASFTVGAGFTPGTPGPLTAEGTVCSLHDGCFPREARQGRGSWASVGRAAVLRIGTMQILLCERPTASGDPAIFRHFGIEPALLDLVVVKANTSFLEPYSAFAGEICYADTPGACRADLKAMEWHRIPEKLYPFYRGADLAPGRAVLCGKETQELKTP